jgi:hypothetical protein
MWAWRAALIIWFLALVCDILASTEKIDRCAVFSSCRGCLREIGCQWCSSSQQCFDVLSPNFTCPEMCVKSELSQCPQSNCTFLTTCTSCTQNNCVWCRDTQKCYEPTIGDPFNMCFPPYSCICPVANTSQCPRKNVTCSQFSDCNTCVKHPECGWCTKLHRCLEATSIGSAPCGNFDCKYWSYRNCSEQCRSNSNCSACVKDSASCSWCAGGIGMEPMWSGNFNNLISRLSFCVLGKTLNQKYHCQRWHNYSCPDCEQYSGTSCMNCTRSQKPNQCGWCYSTKICAEGDTQGPFDQYDCNNTQNWSFTCRTTNWTNITTPVSPSPPPVPVPVPVPVPGSVQKYPQYNSEENGPSEPNESIQCVDYCYDTGLCFSYHMVPRVGTAHFS